MNNPKTGSYRMATSHFIKLNTLPLFERGRLCLSLWQREIERDFVRNVASLI